jgi:dipeptidyl aminopeptidase/acylaminoacyl peptidase
VPDGVSNQTVSLLSTAVDSISPTTVIDRFAFMPTVSDLPYDANNATARFSPNGQYLAIVRNDGSNNAVLHIVNLDEPSLAPVQVDAGDNGDTIATLAFSQDNSQLILVAGTDEGGNNALVQIDLATGNESRIARGRYSQAVIAPDASRIAAMSWVVYDEDEEPYLSLVVVDAESGEETVIFEGGTVDGEGNLTNQAFAYPLSWRTPISE